MIGAILLSPFTRYAAAALAVAGLLLGVYAYGKATARQEAREQALREYAETMERISEDPGIDTSDPDAVMRELCRLSGVADCPAE